MCFDLKCFHGSEPERNHLPYKEQFFSLSQFALQVLITIGIIALLFSFVLARNCLSLHFHLGGNGEFKPSNLLCFPWIFSSHLAWLVMPPFLQIGSSSAIQMFLLPFILVQNFLFCCLQQCKRHSSVFPSYPISSLE